MPTITRACGHQIDFTPHGDGRDEARLAKLRAKNCPPCGLEKNQRDNAAQKTANAQAASKRVRKGQELKLLPDGAFMGFRRQGEAWIGSLVAGGNTIEATASSVLGLVSKLGTGWVRSFQDGQAAGNGKAD